MKNELEKKRRKWILITLCSIIFLTLCSCTENSAESSTEGGLGSDEPTQEDIIASYTNHDLNCDCNDCFLVGNMLTVRDAIYDNPSYSPGLHAISVEKTSFDLESGEEFTNCYTIYVHFHQDYEYVPNEGDLWYLAYEWEGCDGGTVRTNDSRDLAFDINVVESEPDVQDSLYTIY